MPQTALPRSIRKPAGALRPRCERPIRQDTLARTSFTAQANRGGEARSAGENLVSPCLNGNIRISRTCGLRCSCLMAQPRLMRLSVERTNPKSGSAVQTRAGFAKMKKRTRLSSGDPGGGFVGRTKEPKPVGTPSPGGFVDERTNPNRQLYGGRSRVVYDEKARPPLGLARPILV